MQIVLTIFLIVLVSMPLIWCPILIRVADKQEKENNEMQIGYVQCPECKHIRTYEIIKYCQCSRYGDKQYGQMQTVCSVCRHRVFVKEIEDFNAFLKQRYENTHLTIKNDTV